MKSYVAFHKLGRKANPINVIAREVSLKAVRIILQNILQKRFGKDAPAMVYSLAGGDYKGPRINYREDAMTALLEPQTIALKIDAFNTARNRGGTEDLDPTIVQQLQSVHEPKFDRKITKFMDNEYITPESKTLKYVQQQEPQRSEEAILDAIFRPSKKENPDEKV